MFFWATLLAFMVALTFYVTAPVTTSTKDMDKAASEALIQNFLGQHNAAKKYASDLIVASPKAFNKEKSSVSYSASLKADKNKDKTLSSDQKEAAESSVFIFQGLPGGVEGKLGTFVKYISPLQMAPDVVYSDLGNPWDELPKLKTLTATGDYEDAGHFTSMLVCTREKDNWATGDSSASTKVGNLRPCSEDGMKYIVSYGYLQRPDILKKFFLNRNTSAQKAIADKMKGNIDCGFVRRFDVKNIGKVYGIINSNTVTVSSEKLSQSFDRIRRIPTSFARAIGLDELNRTALSELAFCVTPLNKPYAMENLSVHYDTMINHISEYGEPEHLVDVGTVKWENLVADEEISTKKDNWDIGRLNAYSFGKETAEEISIDLKKMEMPYTISYLINYPYCKIDAYHSDDFYCIKEDENTKYTTFAIEDDLGRPLMIANIYRKKLKSASGSSATNDYYVPTLEMLVLDKIEPSGERIYRKVQEKEIPSAPMIEVTYGLSFNNILLYINGDFYDSVEIGKHVADLDVKPAKLIFGKGYSNIKTFSSSATPRRYESLIADIFNIKVYQGIMLNKYVIRENTNSDFIRYNLPNQVKK